MDAQTVRQRSKVSPDDRRTIHEKKLAKARRGLRSLMIAVALPLILSFLSSFLIKPYQSSHEWHPPAWALQVAEAMTAGLMGLAAWMVWAEGGMRSPAPVVLYAAQLTLGLGLAPFAGVGRVGFWVGLVKVVLLAGCAMTFRRVSSFAGNIVYPCVAWAGFMLLLSYKMM